MIKKKKLKFLDPFVIVESTQHSQKKIKYLFINYFHNMTHIINSIIHYIRKIRNKNKTIDPKTIIEVGLKKNSFEGCDTNHEEEVYDPKH